MGDGKKAASGRIQSIDALRGLCVILMVIHHFLYDLVVFLNAPAWLFFNPVFQFLHYVFAGCFILLAGVSSRFSRSNVRRGLKVIAAALAITLVTYFMDMIIVFGILHFMGFAMVFYGLTRKFWDKIPERAAPALYLVLLVGSALALRMIEIDSHWLWPFGIIYQGFYSADYFPIFPWIFVFLLGAWLGKLVVERRLPASVYTVSPAAFPIGGPPRVSGLPAPSAAPLRAHDGHQVAGRKLRIIE